MLTGSCDQQGVELSVDKIRNQGERVIEEDRPGLYREHLERYLFALKYIQPHHVVLDCATGSGYGAHCLSKAAEKVIAVDMSEETIRFAQARYGSPKIHFTCGSAEELDLADNSVDVYCNIETIEHVPHPLRLLAEAKRVLKPGGIFMVSTPNRVASGLKPGQRPSNPFHLFEWSLGEFDGALAPYFLNRQYFGQRIYCSNKFHPVYVRSKLRRTLGKLDIISLPKLPLDFHESREFWQPMNFIALCTA